jgi:hypothetical protein
MRASQGARGHHDLGASQNFERTISRELATPLESTTHGERAIPRESTKASGASHLVREHHN